MLKRKRTGFEERQDYSYIGDKQIYVSPTKTQSLRVLILNISLSNYWLKSIWEEMEMQVGPTCGLYALAFGLKQGFQDTDIFIPPARGEKSFLTTAMELKVSSFGEIFDRDGFKTLTDYYGIPFCEVVSFGTKNITQSIYERTIMAQITRGNYLVASCDINNQFPSPQLGYGTHWVLITDYIFKNNTELSFIVNQHGRQYCWKAKDLYLSNASLPEENPRRKPYYCWYQDPITEEEFFCKTTKAQKNCVLRYPKGDTLDKFKFSLFAIPSNPKSNCLSVEDIAKIQRGVKRHKHMDKAS